MSEEKCENCGMIIRCNHHKDWDFGKCPINDEDECWECLMELARQDECLKVLDMVIERLNLRKKMLQKEMKECIRITPDMEGDIIEEYEDKFNEIALMLFNVNSLKK